MSGVSCVSSVFFVGDCGDSCVCVSNVTVVVGFGDSCVSSVTLVSYW